MEQILRRILLVRKTKKVVPNKPKGQKYFGTKLGEAKKTRAPLVSKKSGSRDAVDPLASPLFNLEE